MVDKIEKEFLSLDDITGGELFFGLAESYQIRYLARELHALKVQYPGLRYHITSGDTEQVTEKLDKGLLDFAVICDAPNGKKYDSIVFPEGDTWGLILPKEDPLAKKENIRVDDLVGLPLFTSEQGWEGDIRKWAGNRFPELHLEGSFRLAYNASMFVREGLGYQLSFQQLVDVSESSGLTFRPLEPRLESKLYLIWNRYQAFTPIAEKLIEQIRRSFVSASQGVV
jgi:DNA-binding transcriptional LysR family regulator